MVQQTLVPLKRTASHVPNLNLAAKESLDLNEKAMGAPSVTSSTKRKKSLKINIMAANNVDDESNFYNQAKVVPEPAV